VLELEGEREGALSRRDEAIRMLERMLAENSVPSDLLRKTGRSREELDHLVRKYKEKQEQDRDASQPETADGADGDVLGGGEGSEVNLDGGLPEMTEAEESEATYEGAGEELSPRYRDLVNRYYKSVSEEQ
jgi:hypothetical protein